MPSLGEYTIDDVRFRAAQLVLAGALVFTVLTSTVGSSIAGQNVTAGLWLYAFLLVGISRDPTSRTLHTWAIPISVLALLARAEGFGQLLVNGAWNLGGTVLIWLTVLLLQISWHIKVAQDSPGDL